MRNANDDEIEFDNNFLQNFYKIRQVIKKFRLDKKVDEKYSDDAQQQDDGEDAANEQQIQVEFREDMQHLSAGDEDFTQQQVKEVLEKALEQRMLES